MWARPWPRPMLVAIPALCLPGSEAFFLLIGRRSVWKDIDWVVTPPIWAQRSPPRVRGRRLGLAPVLCDWLWRMLALSLIGPASQSVLVAGAV